MFGSARLCRAGERVLAIATFCRPRLFSGNWIEAEVGFGAKPKPARPRRALPRISFADLVELHRRFTVESERGAGF